MYGYYARRNAKKNERRGCTTKVKKARQVINHAKHSWLSTHALSNNFSLDCALMPTRDQTKTSCQLTDSFIFAATIRKEIFFFFFFRVKEARNEGRFCMMNEKTSSKNKRLDLLCDLILFFSLSLSPQAKLREKRRKGQVFSLFYYRRIHHDKLCIWFRCKSAMTTVKSCVAQPVRKREAN